MMVKIILNLFEQCQPEERQMFGCYSNQRVEVRYKTESEIQLVSCDKSNFIDPSEKTCLN